MNGVEQMHLIWLYSELFRYLLQVSHGNRVGYISAAKADLAVYNKLL